MRLGRPSQPDPLRNKKTPWGLLRVALLLGFVLIGWQWASQGQNWKRQDRAEPDPLPSLNKLSFEVQPDAAELALTPDEVSILSVDSPVILPDSAKRLPPGWLAMMQDGRLGLSPSEQIGLDQTIEFVRAHNAAELPTPATRDVGFASVNEHPEQYRGRWLEFSGRLWTLSLLRAGGPERTGDEVYEAWLYTPDAANHPTRVLFLDLPATLKLGERLDQPVRFSGCFIKRYGYATARGTHLAPLFVAKTLVLDPEAKTAIPVHRGKTWHRWLGELLVIGAASVLMIWYLTRARKPSHPLRLRM